MPVRGPLARLLLWPVVLGAAALGVVGGLSLRGSGLVAVGLAATLAACTAAGIARESTRNNRRATIEAAVHGAAWTVGVLLVLSGIAGLAGGGVAALVVGAALAAWLVRAALRARPVSPAPPSPGGAGSFQGSPPETSGIPGAIDPGEAGLLLPIWTVSTPALGKEWLSSTLVLAGRLAPAARESLVSRREEVLDELERRDPDGFARWLATGSTTGSDPAAYVRGGPVHNGPAADTDAA